MSCHTKLFETFRFKETCMDTENSIYCYMNKGNEEPVDLKEIYLKTRDKKHPRPILDNEKVCRLCMQIVTRGFTDMRDVDTEVIHALIPEVVSALIDK